VHVPETFCSKSAGSVAPTVIPLADKNSALGSSCGPDVNKVPPLSSPYNGVKLGLAGVKLKDTTSPGSNVEVTIDSIVAVPVLLLYMQGPVGGIWLLEPHERIKAETKTQTDNTKTVNCILRVIDPPYAVVYRQTRILKAYSDCLLADLVEKHFFRAYCLLLLSLFSI